MDGVISITASHPRDVYDEGMKTDTCTAPASPLNNLSVEMIAPEKWPDFCKAFIQEFRGILTSVERSDEIVNEPVAEAHELALEQLSAHTLANGVPAITVVLEGKPRKIRLDSTGPLTLWLYRNSSGWPVRLEILHASGMRILHFTGEMLLGQGASANAWGE